MTTKTNQNVKSAAMPQQSLKMKNIVLTAMNPTGVTVEEVERQIMRCSGFVKMRTGVANNSAYGIMMDCLDQLRRHPKYKQTKRMFEGKQNSVLAIHRAYRNRLRWPHYKDIAFFHVGDMPEQARKKYGIITDAQYFEFWEATGNLAYVKSRPWVTSLWNKFRLSLMKHNVPNADISAWGLVGASVLELACEVWHRSMWSVQEAVPVLRQQVVEEIYFAFSLHPVSIAWQKAFLALCPESDGYSLDTTDEKNITMGLNQLRDLWLSIDLPFDATMKAVEDYADEIFRTRGEAKKSIRELAEMRQEALADAEQQKRNRR